MLFAAVTLGFFAENLREHQIEKHREIQYLKNIHLDLERDIKEIDKVITYNIQQQQTSADLTKLYEKGISNDLPKFYYLVKTLSLRLFFQHSNNGVEQLKNAGGLRLVEDDEIIKQIQMIEIRVANIESMQLNMDQSLIYFRMKWHTILDAVTVHEMNMYYQNSKVFKTNSAKRFEIPTSVRPLHLKSTNDINELVNLGYKIRLALENREILRSPYVSKDDIKAIEFYKYNLTHEQLFHDVFLSIDTIKKDGFKYNKSIENFF
jgi:hypothetical protein